MNVSDVAPLVGYLPVGQSGATIACLIVLPVAKAHFPCLVFHIHVFRNVASPGWYIEMWI
jgi:hypothetical protein